VATLAAFWMFATVDAQAQLSIQTVTWDIIGLDSNKPNAPDNEGPNIYPKACRVTNTSVSTTATNVVVNLSLGAAPVVGATTCPTPCDTANAGLITVHDGTSATTDQIVWPALAPGESQDFYFFVTIARNTAAWEAARTYVMTAQSNEFPLVSTAQTPPRYLYVEKLVEQNRNEVNVITGPATVLVGRTYQFFFLDTATAPGGYEQFESFLIWSNNLFQTISVDARYTQPVNATNSSVYANGCNWNPITRACLGTGKFGDQVLTIFETLILGTAGATTIRAVVHDYSGSSYHYNTDFNAALPDQLVVTAINPSIAGYVFYDRNADGVWQPFVFPVTNNEPAIAGVEVRLFSPGTDGILGTGDDVLVATEFTDASGLYDFGTNTPLPAGNYRVDVIRTSAPVATRFLTTANDPTDLAITLSSRINNLDFGFSDNTLYVRLESFEADGNGLGAPVDVNWVTGEEIDNAGFHIYRAIKFTDGTYYPAERLTETLIAPEAAQGQGASYSLIDSQPLTDDENERAYFLEDVDLNGVRTMHGPAVLVNPDARSTGVKNWEAHE